MVKWGYIDWFGIFKVLLNVNILTESLLTSGVNFIILILIDEIYARFMIHKMLNKPTHRQSASLCNLMQAVFLKLFHFVQEASLPHSL